MNNGTEYELVEEFLIRTYRFSSNSFHDLKTRSTVTIDGERDVLIRTVGNARLAYVLEKKLIAELQIDSDFNYNTYLKELREAFGFFNDPVFEFVIRAKDLEASAAELLSETDQ